MISDNQLIHLALTNNDQSAYTELYNRTFKYARRLVYRRLFTHHDKEELAHDITVHILMNLHKFEGTAKYSSWAFRVCNNQINMFLRTVFGCQARVRKPPVIVSLSDPSYTSDPHSLPFEDEISDNCQPQHAIDAKITIDYALNHPAMLPRRREVLQTYCVEGNTLTETAELLGTTVSAVKALAFHGREQVRELLGGSL